MKTNWNFRTSANKGKDDFLATDKHTFIIRISKNGKFCVYDYRMYSNMATIDFNYWGYSRMSNQVSLKAAKQIALKLFKKELVGN